MSFKVKDSIQVGTVTVVSNSGIIQDAALSDKVTAGTYNGVTVDAKGRVTGGSSTTYLTAEADTLASVTGRGATTSVALSLTNTTASTTTATGALIVSGGVGMVGNLNVGGNTILTGNLTVNGTTTTINSTTVTVDDPTFVLGGVVAPTTDDALDKGIQFRWYDTAARLGFFGMDRSTGYFSYWQSVTDTAGVMSGTLGDMTATNFRGALVGNAGTATYLAGGLIGQIPYQSAVNQTAFLAAGTSGQVLTSGGAAAPTWTTPTTGTVTSVAALTLGTTGTDVSSSIVTGTTTPVITLNIPTASATNRGALSAADWSTFNGKSNNTGTVTSVAALTLGTTGTDIGSSVATGTTTPVITLNIPTASATNRGALSAADWSTFNGKSNTTGTVTSVAALTIVTTGTDISSSVATGTTTPVITIGIPTASAANRGALSAADWSTFNGKQPAGSYLTAEADTLALVTGRGATTTSGVQLNNSALILAPATTAKIWVQAIQPSNITVNTIVTVDSWVTTTYRSCKYTIQVVQGTKYQQSMLSVIHDGTTVYSTEYAVVETNSATPIPVTFTAAIASTTLTVSATITDAATTNATVLIERTLFAV